MRGDDLEIDFLKRFFQPSNNKLIILFLVSSVIVTVCDMVVGYMIREVTDFENDFSSLLLICIIIFSVVAIFGLIFKFMMRYTSGKFTFEFIENLRKKVTKHLSNVSVFERNKVNSGEFISKLSNDMNQIQIFLQSVFFQLMYQPIVFIILFIFLIFISWKLVMVTLLIVPITLVVANYISKPIGAYRKKESVWQSNMLTIAQDSINGIETEKAYDLQGIFNVKYEFSVRKLLRYMLKREKRQALLTPFQMIINILPLMICSIYGGYLAVNNELTAGELFAFVFLVQYLIDPLALIPTFFGEIRTAKASFARIEEILQLTLERDGGEFPHQSASDPLIEFTNVSFSYNNDKNVLQDVSFKVERNRTIALVGASGSGKSTVFNLISGLYEPQEGDIYYHGKNLRSINQEVLRANLAVVLQDTYLFPGTIMENITYGKTDATLDEIVNVAKAACIHDYILSLPEGYETVVGEKGYNLSGGQKQRLSIARALLKGSSILLLDEATSALDPATEIFIQKTFQKYVKNATVLVIAHRLTTIQHADEILVFDNGRIVERGTHEELMKNGKRYFDLHQKNIQEEQSVGG